MSQRPDRRVIAVLGPTNTGKTHLALERMMGHRSGMIGFPLRLLARENYDRVVRIKGAGAVALVTGEERILPPRPAYYLCTAEAMPLDRPVDFLAVDEVQMAADSERGHIFTERLMHARGASETMLLGADTVRPLLRRLVPEAEIVARPRFSTLAYTGPKKLTRLPPRSAVVAFSLADVYAIAELIRRQRGGTAVVMGALSPRTRNAQVELFQAGEVDYLVATDAIGMGLNMDIDHVAFAALRKFDGRDVRRLGAAELAQIAGRAGRHMNNGTFGTTAEVGPLEPEIVEAVENHRFQALGALYWRNTDLDFRSPELLLRSLDRRPPREGLIRVREADDRMALAQLAREPEVAALATSKTRVRLLWEVCQIPDFRKTLSDAHARLLGQVYVLLAQRGRLPADWIARQLTQHDRTEGDIDTLVARIAHTRTWTYISHRADWLAEPLAWQERARAIEDRLSDALHERLTQRFVDRRHAMLARRLKDGGELAASIGAQGEVLVEGQSVGRLEGFRFVPDASAGREEQRRLAATARRALASRMPALVGACANSEDAEFALLPTAEIAWRGAAVARLTGGDSPLNPGVEILAGDLVEGPARERLRRRLAAWLGRWLAAKLAPLWRLRQAPLTGAARGLVFQLSEALGLLPLAGATAQIGALARSDRTRLARMGVRIGTESIWVPALAESGAAALSALLWSTHHRRPPTALPAGRPLSFVLHEGAEPGLCAAIGYRALGPLGIRADALERFAKAARDLSAQGSFAATEHLRALVDCDAPALDRLIVALGYRRQRDQAGLGYTKPAPDGRGRRTGKQHRDRRRPGGHGHRSDSPFARLRDLGFKK